MFVGLHEGKSNEGKKLSDVNGMNAEHVCYEKHKISGIDVAHSLTRVFERKWWILVA